MKTSDYVKAALGCSFLAVSAWITLPSAIPFALQTFVIPLLLFTMGTGISLLSLFLYIALGVIGVPVFSGFGGGVGYLLGPSGGFVLGFLFFPIVYSLLKPVALGSSKKRTFAAFLGLLCCYVFGTSWFLFVYGGRENAGSFWSVLTVCVLPYLPFDILKIWLADRIAARLT